MAIAHSLFHVGFFKVKSSRLFFFFFFFLIQDALSVKMETKEAYPSPNSYGCQRRRSVNSCTKEARENKEIMEMCEIGTDSKSDENGDNAGLIQ